MTSVAKVSKQNVSPGQNAFAGQKASPSEKAVALALGATLPVWKQLVSEMKRDLRIDVAEWHTGSVKYGWSYRLQLKKRNIVYLGPRQGSFVASFMLGDRAVAAAQKSDLPAAVIKTINESRRYAEGTAVRIDVTTPQDLEIIKALAKIKIEN
jgi:hypothetical protein